MSLQSRSPLITTIIPTYKRPRLLKRAIQSVINQTFTDLKICIYDNASDDETEAIVNEFMKLDRRINYHKHEKNIGAMANFQFGLDEVETPFFSFLSDDNFLFPDFYRESVNSLNLNKKYMFYCTPMLAANKDWEIQLVASWESGEYDTASAFMGLWEKIIVWDGVVFRSDVIKNIKKLTGYYGDLSFLMQCASKYSFYVSSYPGACEVWTNNNLSATMSIQDIKSSLTQLWIDVIDNGDLQFDLREKSKKEWEKMAVGRYYRMSLKKFLENDSSQLLFSYKELVDLNAYKKAFVVKILLISNILSPLTRSFFLIIIRIYLFYKSMLYPRLSMTEKKKYQKLLCDQREILEIGE